MIDFDKKRNDSKKTKTKTSGPKVKNIKPSRGQGTK